MSRLDILPAGTHTMTNSAATTATESISSSKAATTQGPSWSTNNVFRSMLAGSVAGMSEHFIMFPVDTVKMRLQMPHQPGAPEYRGVLQTARSIMALEGGFRRLYRGCTAIVGAAIPSHAAYFGTYELVKWELNSRRRSNEASAGVTALAGAAATCAHDFVCTPLDVIKQRMQMYGSKHTCISSCAKTIVRTEGFRALYKSYPTTIALNIPYVSMHFVAYESTKFLLTDSNTRPERTSDFIIAGGVAGGLGGFVSNPLDVVKTRIQTSTSERSLGSTLRHILASEGRAGLFRGCSARVIHMVPSASICWTTYEICKRYLGFEGISLEDFH